MMTVLVFLLCLLSILIYVAPRTSKDDFELLERGDSRILLGTIIGNTEMIKLGIHEGGSVHAVLEPYIANIVLQKSPAHMHLPVCPSVHLAIFMGLKEHLNCATYLLKVGADLSQYELPSGSLEGQDSPAYGNPQESTKDTELLNRIAPRGFPPGFLYAFGFGRPPTSSHAEMILRLYKTLPSKFNVTRLQQYFNVTGNPPLLQITAMNGFLDGTDLIIHHNLYLSNHPRPIDEPDSSGATTLHYAAWTNNIELMVLLLSSQANVSAMDQYGRTALHYAAMRGHAVAANLLVDSLMAEANNSRRTLGILRRQSRLVSLKDVAGRTALDLAALAPPMKSVVEALSVHHETLGIPLGTASSSEPVPTASSSGDGFCEGYRGMDEESVGWNLTCDSTLWRQSQEQQCAEAVAVAVAVAAAEAVEVSESGSGIIATSTCAAVTVDGVTSVSASDLSENAFRRDYFTTQRPVLIRGQLTRGSTLWAHWRKEQFLDRYGALPMRRLMDSTSDEWLLKKPFGDALVAEAGDPVSLRTFVHSFGSSGTSGSSGRNGGGDGVSEGTTGVAYSSSASWFIPSLKQTDLPPPPLLRLCAVSNPYSTERENRHYPYSLALGPAGSFLPLHSSNASWSLLVFGWAEHFLIAPGDRLAAEEVLYNLTTTSTSAAAGEIGESVLVVNNTRSWFQHVAPVLESRGLAHRVRQSAGDVLFVPHNWMRVSLLLSETCLITQEMCSVHNTIHRYTPLGGIIYGGIDKFRSLGGEFNTYQELTKLELSKVVKRVKRSKFPTFEMPPVS